ncbi:regulator of telomere elongation helicase 1 homolog [Hyalella azteca]|uniref:Regulator of telomere elongation helicase 1 homolog n=1 Tax=Hyalella azteca TaxID=294128 RepID=A0A8B7P5J1_HYAAZ|nr:regulator of telomere elongation helicase 1 homolog [Hyalella azteca]
MPQLIINGIPIQFPFEPYEVQRNYMTKVIECLQMNSNGALESPTGTGKTLCLLCASLGWLEHHKAQMQASMNAMSMDTVSSFDSASSNNIGSLPGSSFGLFRGLPKIIYASRTHSQLSQAISELKRTAYKYVKVAVLGSRDQLCIHPEVSKEQNNSTKLHMCQVRVKSKTCYFHNQVEGKKDDPALRSEVMDIEDLVLYGKRRTCCPYYLTRELRHDADIIFMPYNYLLDPRTRMAHGLELHGYVVILDEAHNVEKMCEEAASLQLRSTDIALCIDEVTQVMQRLQESGGDQEAFAANDPGADVPQDFTMDELYLLKAVFLKFEEVVDATPLSKEGASHPGSFMFDLLQQAEITPHKKAIICDLLDKLVTYLTSNSSSPFQRKGAGLQKFSELIKIVFSKDNFSLAHMEAIKTSYRVHVAVEEVKKRQAGGWGSKANGSNFSRDGSNHDSNSGAGQSNTLTSKQGRVLSYWCFNPGFGMKEMVEQGIRCVIITSGTLSPLQSFTQELQVGFPVQLENSHIIKGHQVFVGVVNRGPDGCTLNSSYQNRSRPEYLNSMGNLILNFSRVIPGGLLVFFPSYPILKNCHEHWQINGVWDKITNIKPAFIEPQNKDGFLSTITEFYEKVNDPALRGAIFMAVCRGKVSEGLDFADGNGRAVIVTGLPYPPYKDPRVVLKQQYLNNVLAKNKRGQSGQAWYKLEASRAVNQAIGRVIRHKDDYGAILLADCRFGMGNFSHQLSKWVQPHLKIYPDFAPTMRDLTRFFRTASQLCPKPQQKLTYNGKQLPGARKNQSSTGEYLPMPMAPVGSSALSQAPSRIILRQTTEFMSGNNKSTEFMSVNNKTTEFSKVEPVPPRAFGGHRSLFPQVQNSRAEPKSIFDALTSDAGSPSDNKTDDSDANDSIANDSARKRSRNFPGSFDVLDFNSLGCETSESSSSSSRYENLSSVTKKRKIKVTANINKSQDDQNCPPTNAAQNDAQTRPPGPKNGEEKHEKLKKIAAYVREVKACLPHDSYREFSAAVKLYQTTKRYQDLKLIFLRLFAHPDHHLLLRRFAPFLDSEFRADFLASCDQLTNG